MHSSHFNESKVLLMWNNFKNILQDIFYVDASL